MLIYRYLKNALENLSIILNDFLGIICLIENELVILQVQTERLWYYTDYYKM